MATTSAMVDAAIDPALAGHTEAFVGSGILHGRFIMVYHGLSIWSTAFVL